MNAKPLILVVDDDEPILALMRNILAEFNFETITASSGPQALEAASATRPDLVLLDKNIPGMSGEQVIRAFRGQDGWDGIPILILSGDPVAPGEIEAIGADAAVQKPFDLSNLIVQIRRHLRTDN
jgi:two-component system, OmpR family, KDP operon response regulator KdpE